MDRDETQRLRAEYHERLRKAHLREGFSYLDDEAFVTRPYWPEEPKNRIEPHLWKWPQVRTLTEEAGRMIGLGRGAETYDRRVLALTNPGTRDEFTLSGTLFGDIQLIKPGEAAPCHRHTPCATRFILSGQGGWTTVAHERVHVSPGDIVYTGQFPWHDHGNSGTDDFLFLDVLDIPLQYFTATSAWEFDYVPITGSRENVNQPAHATDIKAEPFLRADLKPRFIPSWRRKPDDFAHLPWARARSSLLELAGEKGSPTDGIRLELTSTAGGPVGRTVSVYTQMLRRGERTTEHRHTAATIYVCIEGRGRVLIEGRPFDFEPNDIFVIPSWHWHRFESVSNDPCFVHSINDASLICKMNLYREQRRAVDGSVLDSGWCDDADPFERA
jgi:gentisate 1,2-dioxygenase